MLDLTYVAGLDLVEEHLAAHRDFLARHYTEGTFLASGRKEPRTGGVILAQGTREQLEAVTASDPFAVHGVARYALTEFLPTMTGPELSELRETAPPG